MVSLHHLLRRARARIDRRRQRVIAGAAMAERIDIGRLMCPLRYDLHIRIEFIRLLRDESALHAEDPDAFLEREPARAYYTWFKEIVCARAGSGRYRNDALVRAAFLERVEETARLWHSINDRGYDPSTPIRLATGDAVRSVNGKRIMSKLFAGDGCHRIACLYLSGQTSLEPHQYEAVVYPRFKPLDNTAILVGHLPLGRAAYLQFISSFYCGGLTPGTPDEILAHVARTRPELLPELESVFAFDLPRIREHG
jgi:hypothetical protein